MSERERWAAAQSYERKYWESRARQIESGASAQLGWYKWRAEQLQQRLRAAGREDLCRGDSRVIEVGSGPVGVATFFPAARAVLIDPLHDFYGSSPILSALRNQCAEYVTGRGEALPVGDGAFDLVIIENCIDHVENMHGVLKELVRVMAPGGLLYLTVNCRSRTGYYMHRVLSRLKIDAGHPYTFTPARLTRLLGQYGLSVRDAEYGSYLKAWQEDLASPSRTAKAKALLGVSEYLASVLALPATSGRDDTRQPKHEAAVAYAGGHIEARRR
jgi:SAM-dependent methyltransferase